MTATAMELWNARLLGVFGPLLILTGIAGFLIPPRLALLSGAAPYNVFHILFGALGTTLVLARCATAVAIFNLGFGVADIFQAAAGMRGYYPARVFRYKTGDHVVHVVFGLVLAIVGGWGLVGGRL